MAIRNSRCTRAQAIRNGNIEPAGDYRVRLGIISPVSIRTQLDQTELDQTQSDQTQSDQTRLDQTGLGLQPSSSRPSPRLTVSFRFPRNVLIVCVGQSTYARCGFVQSATPFEPEWEGFRCREIPNATTLPAKVDANQGLCQIKFFRSRNAFQVRHADRTGRRQSRQGTVLPRL